MMFYKLNYFFDKVNEKIAKKLFKYLPKTIHPMMMRIKVINFQLIPT